MLSISNPLVTAVASGRLTVARLPLLARAAAAGAGPEAAAAAAPARLLPAHLLLVSEGPRQAFTPHSSLSLAASPHPAPTPTLLQVRTAASAAARSGRGDGNAAGSSRRVSQNSSSDDSDIASADDNSGSGSGGPAWRRRGGRAFDTAESPDAWRRRLLSNAERVRKQVADQLLEQGW